MDNWTVAGPNDWTCTRQGRAGWARSPPNDWTCMRQGRAGWARVPPNDWTCMRQGRAGRVRVPPNDWTCMRQGRAGWVRVPSNSHSVKPIRRGSRTFSWGLRGLCHQPNFSGWGGLNPTTFSEPSRLKSTVSIEMEELFSFIISGTQLATHSCFHSATPDSAPTQDYFFCKTYFK